LLVSDIDGTLVLGPGLDQPGLPELKEFLAQRGKRFLFAVATGRDLDSARQVLSQFGLPTPDIFIASVGTEIYDLRGSVKPDTAWAAHLNHRWNAWAARKAVAKVSGLRSQPDGSQRRFKVSYFIERSYRDGAVEAALARHGFKVTVIQSQGCCLDILPRRASKGRAIRWVSRRLGIPSGRVLACGDSGNDLDMLASSAMAVVVGNYSKELDVLRCHRQVWFSSRPAASGVLDGAQRFSFPPA